MTVVVGDRVLLPESEWTKFRMKRQDYYIVRESDLVGKFVIDDSD